MIWMEKSPAFALQRTAPDMQPSEFPCNPAAKPVAECKNLFLYLEISSR
jgi:hypothetical protein